jgi:hypothetical protein
VAGDVYSCQQRNGAGIGKRWRRLKHQRHTFGYPVIQLGKGRQWPIHELVLRAFVGPRPAGMVCCHEDGKPANCHLSNLRWDTYSGNEKDKDRHGTRPDIRGEKGPGAKLTPADVRLIRQLHAEGWGYRRLAKRFHRGIITMRDVVKHVTWTNVN